MLLLKKRIQSGTAAVVAALACLMLTASSAHAVTLGFTETFDSGVAGWEDNVNNPLSIVASGGDGGGAYASGTFNFNGYSNPFGGGPVTFRASFSDNPSGGAFAGNYLTEGVGSIAVSFRHNAPEPLTLFLRVATAANFPGAVLAQTVSAATNEWTRIVFDIDPNSPFCFTEGGPCAAAFSNVQNLQFGTDAPAGLLDDDIAYSLDIDQISILPVPEPGTALLMGLGLAGLASVQRRENSL